MTHGPRLGEKVSSNSMPQSLTVTPPPPLRVPRFVRDWYERHVDRRNYLGQVLRKARRFYLGTFHPEYVKQSVAANREGECHRGKSHNGIEECAYDAHRDHPLAGTRTNPPPTRSD